MATTIYPFHTKPKLLLLFFPTSISLEGPDLVQQDNGQRRKAGFVTFEKAYDWFQHVLAIADV